MKGCVALPGTVSCRIKNKQSQYVSWISFHIVHYTPISIKIICVSTACLFCWAFEGFYYCWCEWVMHSLIGVTKTSAKDLAQIQSSVTNSGRCVFGSKCSSVTVRRQVLINFHTRRCNFSLLIQEGTHFTRINPESSNLQSFGVCMSVNCFILYTLYTDLSYLNPIFYGLLSLWTSS